MSIEERIATTSQVARSRNPNRSELLFLGRSFVHCTLPHRDPRALMWTRQAGRYKLTLKEPNPARPFGLPYGPKARLLLLAFSTAAMHARSPVLDVREALEPFLSRLGVSWFSGGGVRGDRAIVRRQLRKLLHSVFLFEDMGDANRDRWSGSLFAEHADIEWSPKRHFPVGGQIEIGGAVFHALSSMPVPLDLRAVRALRHSSLALDLYALVSNRSFVAKQWERPETLYWADLMQQVGTGFSSMRNFRASVKGVLPKIKAVYPTLRYEFQGGHRNQRAGLVVMPDSWPSVLS